MGRLSLLSNSKGGVGKSFTARTFIQYCLDHGIDIRPFDLDRSNADVYRCYRRVLNVQLAILSESEKFQDSANDMFNAAIEHEVIANLPAQYGPALRDWIQKNQLLELADEAGVDLRMFWVCDAGYDSLQLLKRSLKDYGHCIQHVLVANHGKTDDRSFLEADEAFQEMLATYSVPTMVLPKFIGNYERNFIDAQSLDFGTARTHPDLGLISRQRIKTYLRKAYAAIEAAELFTVPVATAPIEQGQRKPQHSSRQRVSSREDG